MENRKRPSQAYYGMEIHNHSDLTFEDLMRVLAMLLMPKPYIWSKIKFVTQMPTEYECGPTRFFVSFTDLLCNEDYDMIEEILSTGKTTSVYGLSI